MQLFKKSIHIIHDLRKKPQSEVKFSNYFLVFVSLAFGLFVVVFDFYFGCCCLINKLSQTVGFG